MNAATPASHAVNLLKAALNYRGQRPAIVRSYFFQVMRRFTPSVATAHGSDWYYVSTADRVGRNMFVRGLREEHRLMAQSLTLAEEVYGREKLLLDRTFIDVGANIGTSTIPALKDFGARRALAIEPSPLNFKLLETNLAANGVHDRVDAVLVALSDRGGTGVLALSSTSGADNRVRAGTAVLAGDDGDDDEGQRETVEIALARFDDILAERNVDLDGVGLVWMDVQGHEGHVLAGAPSLLETTTPLFIEYWPYGLRRSGGWPLLHEIIATNYRRVVDVGASLAASSVVEVAAKEAHTLAARYPGEAYTDLLLVK